MLTRALQGANGGGDTEWIVGTKSNNDKTMNFTWDKPCESFILFGRLNVSNAQPMLIYGSMADDNIIAGVSSDTVITGRTFAQTFATSNKTTTSISFSHSLNWDYGYLIPINDLKP